MIRQTLDISDRLRALLSEWLTVPIPFDRSVRGAVSDVLGQAETVQGRWGADIRKLYETALRSADDISSAENPLREKLRSVLGELLAQEQTFKIYCHRRARPYFESILIFQGKSSLLENAFLHSVRDYRETEPFDVLIKIGPFRIRGWGSAPDALITAPRFGTIIQIVWAGCGDDPGFGYDPVSPLAADDSSQPSRRPAEWIKRVTRIGEDPEAVVGYSSETDELMSFTAMNQPREKRPAKLLQIDGEHGILYPPHSRVLSFNPNPTASDPIGRRIPGETLVEGMFVIMPLIGNVDLGGVQAEHGYYSKLWKAKLDSEFLTDAPHLIKRLREAGLNLVHLDAAIINWAKPPSTVIHAPQQRKHFEILLRVLGFHGDDNNGQLNNSFWRLAWNEVRRSRGEAIQAGFQEQEIVEEQLIAILRKLLPGIREHALANNGFNLAIPDGNGIKGLVLFLRVCGIEEGFNVPGTELRVVRELSVIDQWRE